MYTGRGKENPSITTRISLLEEVVGLVAASLRTLVYLTVGTLLTAIGSIAVRLFFKV
jgi:hypothetical protein